MLLTSPCQQPTLLLEQDYFLYAFDLKCINFIEATITKIAEDSQIAEVVAKSVENGAAGVVCPLVSTLVVPDQESFLQECILRDQYKNSEMPQSFIFKMILDAYQRCPEDELDTGTECLSIALKYGGTKAFLVQGTPELWKVTYPQDLEVANILLSKYCQKIGILNLNCPLATHVDSITSCIEKEFCKQFNIPLVEPISQIECCPHKLLCKETQKTITNMMPVTNNYYETVILSHKLTTPVCLSVLVVVCCVNDITDIKNIFTQHGTFVHQASTRSILFFFNAKFIADVLNQTSSLRNILLDSFSGNMHVSVIICDSSNSENTLSDSHKAFVKIQNIMEVSLSKYKINLNRQILFC